MDGELQRLLHWLSRCHRLYKYGIPPLWNTHLTNCAAQESDGSFEFSDPLWVDVVGYSIVGSCSEGSVRECVRVCVNVHS